MMWQYAGDGWTWLWMTGMMVVFWGAIILAAVWIVRGLSSAKPRDDEAISTLRNRLAAGQINQDEFEKTRKLLQG